MKSLFPMILVCSAVMSVLVFIFTLSIALRYPSDNFSDWDFLLPILFPIVPTALAGSIHLHRARSGNFLGGLWGAFIASYLYLLLQAWTVMFSDQPIRTDGTAYWGLLSIPAFFIGLIGTVICAALGVMIAYVIRRLKKTR